MALAHSNENYLYGKGRLYFKKDGESGYLDFGNVPKLEINVEVEKAEHYSSRSGTREKDLETVLQKKAESSFDLEEYSAENLNLAFLGDGVQESSQSAGQIDAVETTTVADRYIDLGKQDLYVTKLTHGTVTDGPFEAGETITGGTSGATAKVAWVDTGFLEVINISDGPFQSGEEISGGTSSATANLTNAGEEMDDVVVTDAASPSTRYTAGTDYDADVIGGLLRERSGGSIASNTCYVSCDCRGKTLKAIRALTSSNIEGELLFIGDPDQGPRWRVEGWDVLLTISGGAGMISDEIVAISMAASFQKDETNHPSEPFFRATEIS